MFTDTDLPAINWDDDDDDAPFAIEYEVRSASSSNYEGDSDVSSDEETHRTPVRFRLSRVNPTLPTPQLY